MAAVLCGQVSVGWANDAVDAPLDRRAGRADKPIAAGQVSQRTVLRCASTALVVDVPLSLAVGWRAGAAHLVAVGFAWLYDLGLKRTVASVLPYAVSFGLVPVIVAAALPGSPRPRLALVGAGVACGIGACRSGSDPGIRHSSRVAWSRWRAASCWSPSAPDRSRSRPSRLTS
jgi:4-hydroxybenzoate polyprenyltransferase